MLYPNLQGALQAEGKTAPTSLPPDLSAQIQKLGSLSGPAFDREFVADELAAHQRAVQIMQREDTIHAGHGAEDAGGDGDAGRAGQPDRLNFLSGDLAPNRADTPAASPAIGRCGQRGAVRCETRLPLHARRACAMSCPVPARPFGGRPEESRHARCAYAGGFAGRAPRCSARAGC